MAGTIGALLILFGAAALLATVGDLTTAGTIGAGVTDGVGIDGTTGAGTIGALLILFGVAAFTVAAFGVVDFMVMPGDGITAGTTGDGTMDFMATTDIIE